MFYAPNTPLLPLHEPPITRPGYEIPPALAASPRPTRLRALAARLTLTRPKAAEADQVSACP